MARRALPTLITVIVAFGVLLAAQAEALVYWVNNGDNTIGRANLDGSGVDPSFIAPGGLVGPNYGIAVDEEHIYWSTSGWIGRANLDGSGVIPTFVPTHPAGSYGELAIDGRHLYWSNNSYGWIGRANLDGTGVTQQLLAPQSDDVHGLTAGGGHIYWGDYQNSRIGRGLPGVDPLFINPTADRPEGVAVDGSHVYWGNGSGETIGRASLNGSGVDQDFIATSYVYGVEVDDRHVYWANYDTNSIGRANLDGSNRDVSFITGADSPQGVAVDWIANPGAAFRIVGTKINKRKGTAKVVVKVPGPGKLTLSGKGLKRVRKSVGKPRVGLRARPKGKLKRKLRATGKAKAKARIRFRPELSNKSKTRKKKLKLRRHS